MAALAVGMARPRVAPSGTLELVNLVLLLVIQVQRRPRGAHGAGAHVGAAAEAGQDGCVIYCTLLQAEAGESWGWAGFQSWLPQAALRSPQPLLGCPGMFDAEQKLSPNPHPSPGRFSVPLKGAHGCFEQAAGTGPGPSVGSGQQRGRFPSPAGIPSFPGCHEGLSCAARPVERSGTDRLRCLPDPGAAAGGRRGRQC